ncbi:MAG: recombination protein RecR [Clostridia bacterium]|nr:recombination protein RecR [Clostridia bacterium]MBR6603151.1 recombination protein RecR [Clostridia bacterium]
MADYIEPLQKLAEQFGKLSGIGRKTAMRLAFSVLDMSEEEAAEFASSVIEAKEKIHLCPICQNLTDKEKCDICSDETRDRSVICVVEDAKAVIALENVREYNGLYHVLGGVISPMNGVTPEKLRIKELLTRLEDSEIKEVIIATNPTVEGEATSMYLSRLLKPAGIAVTRLAYGIPVGGDLEYADAVTLYRALEGRRDV